MKYTLLFFLFSIQAVFNEPQDVETNLEESEESEGMPSDNIDRLPGKDRPNVEMANCWMSLNTRKITKAINSIDARYASMRKTIQEDVVKNKVDYILMNGLIMNRGVALRELFKHHSYTPHVIPSGINLGGYCMIKMPDSVLFFHRMKLRNSTFFRVNSLTNSLEDMVMKIDLSLNDLHLIGAYERALTDKDPSVLIYAPTFGEVQFLLKDVKYKVEGRYRLIKHRLRIEMIKSDIIADNVMMTYVNQDTQNQAERIGSQYLGEFISRLKIDLDKWLKDYFNDFLVFADISGLDQVEGLEKYDKEKTTVLAEYMDEAIEAIKTRLKTLNAATINVPSFTFKAFNGLNIKLFDGLLQGLDSIYRRDIVTTGKQRDLRTLDTIVGFSNLKVVYKYESVIPTGVPPLTGTMTLSANELTAFLSVAMVDDPDAIDLDFEFLGQMKPESMTVEGAANIMISNFKHLLEHQIISIMSNFLVYGVKLLKSLPKCEPFEPGQIAVPVEQDKGKLIIDPESSTEAEDEELRMSNKSRVNSQDFKKALRVTKSSHSISPNTTKYPKMKRLRRNQPKSLRDF